MNRLMKLNLCFATIITLVMFVACAKDEITSLTLNYTSLNFSIGQTDSLVAIIAGNGDIQKFPISWSTSDSTVVTVVKGKIEAIAKGSATITAKTGSKMASCTVIVTNQLYPVTTEGYLVYRGDFFNAGLSNYFDVYLVGKADTMVLSFNLSLNVKDSLPVGNYPISTIQNQEDLKPNVANSAFSDGRYIYGSYYYKNFLNPVSSGKILVSSSNGNYIIEYDLLDLYGNTIYGTYVGKLIYRNTVTASSVPAISKVPINQLFNKESKLQKLNKP